MNNTFTNYKIRDFLVAAGIALLILLLCGLQLNPGMPSWGGDDFAAYISEGIAISNGTFPEQTDRNFIQHPSPLPEEADEKNLVYVWGFPLLLSLVHRLVGFDLIHYSSFFFYKIPSLLAFPLQPVRCTYIIADSSGKLFLHFWRCFSVPVSILSSRLII